MKKLIAYVGALLLALGVTLAVAAPAQAYGWSGQRCQTQSGNGAKVCVQVHTIARGNGTSGPGRHEGAYKVDNAYGNHFRGIKNNALALLGSSGNVLGQTGLPDLSATYAGVCGYVNVALDGGNGSCVTMYGKLDLSVYWDEAYSVSVKALGGAC